MRKPLTFLCLCFLIHYIDVLIFYKYIIMINRWEFFDKLKVLFNFVVVINNTRLVKIPGTDFALLAECTKKVAHINVWQSILWVLIIVSPVFWNPEWVLVPSPVDAEFPQLQSRFGLAQVVCNFLTLLLRSFIVLEMLAFWTILLWLL